MSVVTQKRFEEGIADGPDQIRAAARYQIKYGADVIKTCATGGVLSEGDAVGATQYTFEELKAMVDEATKVVFVMKNGVIYRARYCAYLTLFLT